MFNSMPVRGVVPMVEVAMSERSIAEMALRIKLGWWLLGPGRWIPLCYARRAALPAANALACAAVSAVAAWHMLCAALFVGLGPQQAKRLDMHGQCDAPQGPGRWCFWPLKRGAVGASSSAIASHVGLPLAEVVLRPVSITFVGLLKMVESGEMSCCDEGQWRLYAPLQIPAPRDADGNVLYHIHDAFVIRNLVAAGVFDCAV
eukprot:s366_g38.t1